MAEEVNEKKAKVKQQLTEEKKKEAPKAEEHKHDGKEHDHKAEALKKETKKEDKKEIKAPVIKEERIVTVPLRDAWDSPRHKRARRAVTVLSDHLKKHFKMDVKIDETLNEVIWARGIRKPPRVVKVKVQITDAGAKAYPAQ